MELLREFCAENMTHVPAAIEAGARRIELCDNLAVGGTTPSYGVIKAAVAFAREHDVDVMAMVRPRGGNFFYHEAELQSMLEDLSLARRLGVTGVVFGCLRERGGHTALDLEAIRRLTDAAKGNGAGRAVGTVPVEVTFHMAFDELGAETQLQAIDELAALGIERVLTHGGPAETAILDNISHLHELVDHAREKLTILPGGGITWQNAEHVANLLGVHEVHGTRIVRW